MANTLISSQRPNARRQPPFETPWSKSSSLRTPYASSSRSSSITRSIFDDDPTENGTPLTPPDTSSSKPENEGELYFKYGNKRFSEAELRGKRQTDKGSDGAGELLLHERLADEKQRDASGIDGFSLLFSGLSIEEQKTSSLAHRQTDFLKRQEETPSKHKRSSSLSVKPKTQRLRSGIGSSLSPESTRPRPTSPAVAQRAVSDGGILKLNSTPQAVREGQEYIRGNSDHVRASRAIVLSRASANTSGGKVEETFPFSIYPQVDLDSITKKVQNTTKTQRCPRQVSIPKHPSTALPDQQQTDTGIPYFRPYYKKDQSEEQLKKRILDIIAKPKKPAKFSLAQLVQKLIHIIKQQIAREKGAKKPRRKPKPKEPNKIGYIYVFTSSLHPKYVKIGMSAQGAEDRTEEWGTTCKHLNPKLVHDPIAVPFPHFSKVERLIHAELGNKRRRIPCGTCKKTKRSKADKDEPREHIEWFEISVEMALEVVQRWRAWIIKHEPFRDDGSLKQIWEWKCRRERVSRRFDWGRWTCLRRHEEFIYSWHSFDAWLDEYGPKCMSVLRSLPDVFIWSVPVLIFLGLAWLEMGRLGFVAGLAAFLLRFVKWLRR
jgi:hypothetical protein